jgi:hypothetical protein
MSKQILKTYDTKFIPLHSRIPESQSAELESDDIVHQQDRIEELPMENIPSLSSTSSSSTINSLSNQVPSSSRYGRSSGYFNLLEQRMIRQGELLNFNDVSETEPILNANILSLSEQSLESYVKESSLRNQDTYHDRKLVENVTMESGEIKLDFQRLSINQSSIDDFSTTSQVSTQNNIGLSEQLLLSSEDISSSSVRVSFESNTDSQLHHQPLDSNVKGDSDIESDDQKLSEWSLLSSHKK